MPPVTNQKNNQQQQQQKHKKQTKEQEKQEQEQQEQPRQFPPGIFQASLGIASFRNAGTVVWYVFSKVAAACWGPRRRRQAVGWHRLSGLEPVNHITKLSI